MCPLSQMLRGHSLNTRRMRGHTAVACCCCQRRCVCAASDAVRHLVRLFEGTVPNPVGDFPFVSFEDRNTCLCCKFMHVGSKRKANTLGAKDRHTNSTATAGSPEEVEALANPLDAAAQKPRRRMYYETREWHWHSGLQSLAYHLNGNVTPS